MSTLAGSLQRFATVLVGIFVEAAPFLLFGVLVSSLFAALVGTERLQRFFPTQRLRALGVASVLGFGFPICDCGLIPIGRGMLRVGVPTSVALTFMLAAPIVNPIVLWSTWTAFGNRPGLVVLRFGVALLVAWSVGLLASTVLRRVTLVNSKLDAHGSPDDVRPTGIVPRVRGALVASHADFLEMATFLTVGAAVAAAIQVLLPQSDLLPLARGPLVSVLVLMSLRGLMSVCAAVDAFLALAFSSTFSPGALVAFMAFGPVFDLKNAFLIGGTFGRRLVLLYLAAVTPVVLLSGVAINLLLPGL